MRLRLLPVKVLNGRTSRKASADEPTNIATESGIDISAQLKKKIQMLYVAHVSEEGVDYASMTSSEQFTSYVEETSRLPYLDLAAALPDDAHKIAFFVNLYNALTQHAVAALGPPPNGGILRLFHGMMVGYLVGPHKLTLNDMENGILRANQSISVMPKPFSKKDPRIPLCVDRVDPRIHFVLNCAANSCPPVLFLTPDNLERSLQIAALGFLASEDNFTMSGSIASLSMIFNWYRSDFSKDGTEKGILEYILANADPDQDNVKQLRQQMEASPEQVSIQWKMYDWALNST